MDQPPASTTARRRLVLHIGFHKTGTSAIQETLFEWRVRLRDHGVVYPQPISGHASHLDLASALGFNPRETELSHYAPAAMIERYQRLITDSPDGSTIVLSSEEFCQGDWRAGAMEALLRFLDPLDVDVIVVAYVRDPLRFLLSIYHHELRDVDITARFVDWVETFPMRGVDFAARLEPWRRHLGHRAELVVRDYEAVRARGSTIVHDFLEAADLERVDLPLPDRPFDAGIHPHLVEPLIAVRKSDLPAERKRHLLDQLLTIGELMSPVDAADHYLDIDSKRHLESRLEQLRSPIESHRSANDAGG